ncbi:MAG: DUF4382 domain-containing protein [Ramlibacter sp.]
MTFLDTSRTPWGRSLRWLAALGAAAVLAACGGGGGGGGDSGTTGSLRLAMTDAPSCGFDHIWVTVEKVSVHQSAAAADSDSGWVDLTLSPARRIDLLALTNGVLEELGTIPLQAGSYSQIRLVLATNTGTGSGALANALQPTGGNVIALSTPSAQQSGLKLQAHFDVAAGQMADLVLDFDACKSIVKAGNSGQYILKPVVSVHQRLVAGLQGFVSTTLPRASTTVRAQLNGVTVRSTSPDGAGRFSIPYLAAGTYVLVVQSDGRATAVVTGVPVSTGTTTMVNGTATAITPPASIMADVAGAVTLTTGSTTSPLTDASARALQALTGGPTIELGDQAVDATLGTYRFRLPVAAPVKAAFATPLVFASDAAVAGLYTIQVRSPGRATQEKPAGIASGTSATVNFGYP